MNTVTDEHLDLIVKRCTELLEMAGKRTPGEWHERFLRIHDQNAREIVKFNSPDFSDMQEINNAQFIASCAGNAEAGWRATIAAVEMMKRNGWGDSDLADQITAAWPIELLKP